MSIHNPVIVLDPTWASRQFIPGGSANRYVDTRARKAVRYMKLLAPKRTGNLAAHSKKTGTLNRGRLAAVCTIYNDADYAHFVALGTTGPIVSYGGKPMPIPLYGRGLRQSVVSGNHIVFRYSVRGQTRNTFMDQAVALAFPTGGAGGFTWLT